MKRYDIPSGAKYLHIEMPGFKVRVWIEEKPPSWWPGPWRWEVTYSGEPEPRDSGAGCATIDEAADTAVGVAKGFYA